MKEFDITIPIKEYRYDELPERYRMLTTAAREATSRSYAPYSHFRVGAAILLENGEVVTGANQENAAYSSGTCAERTACYYAGATYPGVGFEAIAIGAVGTDDAEPAEPVSPCGACRQALVEYEKLTGHAVKVLLCGREKVYELGSVAALLPFTFLDF